MAEGEEWIKDRTMEGWAEYGRRNDGRVIQAGMGKGAKGYFVRRMELRFRGSVYYMDRRP